MVGEGDAEGLVRGVELAEALAVGEGEGDVSGVELNANVFDSAVRPKLYTFATCWV